MRSLNSIGLGLSLAFGCLLVALMGEIYYLLWWKRRSWNRGVIEDDCCSSSATTSSSSSARELMYMFCCKKSFSSTQPLSSTTITDRLQQRNEIEHNFNKDLLLFTIKEETREDLESEDGSDLLVVHNSGVDIETPYLTPLSSPSMFTPPLTPLNSSYTHLGLKFNPLFESSSDADLSRLKTSPPPKFKFLREAEDKFHRRRMMEEEVNHMDHFDDGQNPESCITIIVANGGSDE